MSVQLAAACDHASETSGTRVWIALAMWVAISITLLSGAYPASASIYDAQVESRIKLTAKQRPKVRRIINRSNSDLVRALRKYGIDPYDPRPRLFKLMGASRDLRAVGRRTRLQLARVLTAKQMRQYDVLVRQVERRVRRAIMPRLTAKKTKKRDGK